MNEPREIEREVREIRGDLTGIVRELDHRRHELLDWRLQLRRHPGVIATVVGGLLALVGGSILVAARKRRRERGVLSHASRMRRALGRFYDDPDRVAPPEPSMARKVLSAAAAAAGAAAGKKAAVMIFNREHGATR